jgi:hypothetical protein
MPNHSKKLIDNHKKLQDALTLLRLKRFLVFCSIMIVLLYFFSKNKTDNSQEDYESRSLAKKEEVVGILK